MSGKIRTGLGRDRALAEKHCHEYEEQLIAHPAPWGIAAKAKFNGLLVLLQKDAKKLEDAWKKWEVLVDRIINDTEHKAEQDLFDEWKSKEEFEEVMDKLDCYAAEIQSYMLVEWTPNAPAVPSIASSSEDDEEPDMTPINISSLPIPKFGGDYAEWNSFQELFDLYVHQRHYPAVSKLAALRSLLFGRALDEIKGFTTSGANYDTVLTTLKERFGNQQFVIRELELKLDSLPPARPNPASIGSTVTSVTNLCRQLKNLGIDTNNNAMKNSVIKKMPFKQQQELQEMLFDEPATSIDAVLAKMKKMEMKAELFSSIAPSSNSYTPPSTSQSWKGRYAPPSTVPPWKRPVDSSRTSWKNQNESPNNIKTACTFCDGDHPSVICKIYPSSEQRIQQLKQKKRCVNCMGLGHYSSNCPRNDLKCRNCQQPHYAFLCSKGEQQRTSKAMMSISKTHSTLLTKNVKVFNVDSNNSFSATLFFDSGAQRSYVTNDLIKTLNLPTVNREKLNVQGFGGRTSVYDSDLVKVRIKTVDGFKDILANSTKKIADHLPVIERKNIDDYSKSNQVPDILIGMDYFCQFIASFKEVKEELFEAESIVGKIYAGKVPINNDSTVSSLAIDPQMQCGPEECETFWKLESMGIVDCSLERKEDKIAQEKLESSMQFKNNRYYISWPFKSDTLQLPSNAGVAIGRLRSTLQKLLQDPEFMTQYQAIIDDQLKRGTIEIAPKVPEGKVVHYLSHHAVLTPQKSTTKIRMVYDGSAKLSKDSPSLNDCLYRGPIDMPEIPGLLMRIRKAQILVTGDIEKAFHQIYLNEVDRDAVRFFWVKDVSKPVEGDNLIVYRFVGVPFGVITSPAILGATVKCHLKKKNDPNLLRLLENLFVDNIFLLEENPEEAIRMFNLVRSHFLDASMNVREWLSNNAIVLNAIPEVIRQTAMVTKILGLEWDAENDTMSIAIKENNLSPPWTKRKVLKLIASTYDPLGFLSPVTIKARIFMQQLFQYDLKWDDKLSATLLEQWMEILKYWKGSIAIQRKFIQSKFPDPEDVEIHIFADASKDAYCAAVYLRIKTPDGYVTPLVFAKTRLQPINKNLTIPKMEIMGIWLAAKIGIYVAKEMKLDRCKKFIWTDSQISFYWFKKWPKEVFVANRLKEVLEAEAECLFVPGKLNPADLGTRGITLEELQKDSRWLNGPDFLREPKEKWPGTPDLGLDLTPTVAALVSNSNETLKANFQPTIVDRIYPVNEELSWDEQKMHIARQLKPTGEIQTEYLQTAEVKLILQEQESFIKQIDIKQLKLVKDEEGIYRTHCRFDHAELLNINPILIPKKSSIAQMICMDVHKKLQHAGIPHTLSKLREKYWIPSGRATVMKCINKCSECKYWKSKPFSLPNMPQLPAARINRSKPFENVGIDYCGPFKVKGKEEKAWIILFTCFSTRLLHLELVSTMTAEDFLLSFRKFVARCGAPKYVLSDNAKQFKTTANALDDIWKKAIKDEQSIDYSLKNDITWDFITERAPWKGGLYDRLVALVKNSLKFCIGKKCINLSEFSALLCEIEATLNSRPLTYVHANDPFVIRPADFIYPSIDLMVPTNEYGDENADPAYMPSNAAGGERLVEKYLKSLQLVDSFWNRWSHDYLNMLRERNNDEHKNARGATKRNPIAGEYVLVSEADQPRGIWKIAKIVDCVKSSDGEIRSAEIQYLNGFTTRRAINHLYPLENSATSLDISLFSDNSIVSSTS